MLLQELHVRWKTNRFPNTWKRVLYKSGAQYCNGQHWNLAISYSCISFYSFCDVILKNMKYNYKPSLQELKFSLKLRSREYFLENTLHGIPYIVDPTRPMWERIIWLILTLASLGAAIGIIVIIWNKFQNEPTITGIELSEYHTHIYFPQIFICYDWNQLDSSTIDESQKDQYKEIYNWSWEKTINTGSDRSPFHHYDDFYNDFQSMSPECNQVLNSCSFSGKNSSCNTMFKRVITPFGVCCKYNHSKPITTSDSPWVLNFQVLTYPVRIHMMTPFAIGPNRNERPLLELNRTFAVAFGNKITDADPNMRFLTQRQRQCSYKELDYTACEIHCLSSKLFESCGCVPWFLKSSNYKECPVKEYNCLKVSYFDVNKCKCMLPCNSMSFVPLKVTFPNDESNKINSIKMLHWPRGFYVRKTRFGFLDLLVSFGGICGLFLGYSVLTTVEFGYYFSLRAYCGAVVHSSRASHNITTINVLSLKTPPTNNIKPVIYYQYVD